MTILTQQKRVPWTWALVVLFPWVALSVGQYLTVVGFTFTLKKFTSDPVIISLVTGSKQGVALLVGALVSFASDRIWTRWGRRKPILVVGWAFSGLMLFLVPYAPNLTVLVIVVFFYVFFIDMSGPYEVATMEVVPPPQRGRAGAITHLYKAGANLVFFAVLVANFDERYEVAGFAITGEQVMYFSVGAVLLTSAMLYGRFVQEVKPPGAEVYPWRQLPLKRFFKDVLSPEIAPLYGLMFAMQTFWLSTLQFEALLVTEQWGYSKTDYGNVMSISTIVAVVLVPLGGMVSDRVDRLKLTKIGLVGVLSAKILYYVYCEYVAPGAIPPFAMVVVLGLLKVAIGSFLAVACVPMIFDLLDTNRFGTFACGNMIVMSLVAFVGANVMGLWVKASAPWLYGLEEGTYNYMAAFHWVFLVGFIGAAYLFVFERRWMPGLRAGRADFLAKEAREARNQSD